MTDLSKRLAHLPDGTPLRVTYTAFIAAGYNLDEHLIAVRRPLPEHNNHIWYENISAGDVQIDILAPDVEPGTVISAGGVLWVVRKSNPRDSYRVMPVDLSGKLRTLPIEEFFNRYPAAKIKFDPNAE